MEERREETRMLMQEDEQRRERAKEKEARWGLMRECMTFLKENSKEWHERKLRECERMRKEAKEDRMAVVRMKKKRYGIKTMSKEENTRFKEMSERKILLAKARGNLWKLAREPRCRMEESEREAWVTIGEGAVDLTEHDDWESGYEVDIRELMTKGLLRKPVDFQGSGREEPSQAVHPKILPDAQHVHHDQPLIALKQERPMM